MQSLSRVRAQVISCLSISGLLFCYSQALPSYAEEKSLVESALDLPGTDDLPSQAPISASNPESAKTQKSATSQAADDLQREYTSGQVPLQENSPGDPNQMSASGARGKVDVSDPENAKLQSPAIHSELTVTNSKLFGVKTGKTFAVDPTYRGLPVLPVTIPSVTVGTPSWAIPAKKKVAAIPTAPLNATTGVLPGINKNGVETEKRAAQSVSTVNVRFLTMKNFQPADIVYAYPYPVKPPKPMKIDPLPESEGFLRNMILGTGYTSRLDLSRPYPNGGWRWVRVYETALRKSGTHEPHTMITCYPWVNKMFPYVFAEVRALNELEAQRAVRYAKVIEEFESLGGEMESKAAAAGLVPIPIKINSKGIGQVTLPAGAWWLTATRRLPGIKFYWQLPIRCNSGEALNAQFTEANALIIQGGW